MHKFKKLLISTRACSFRNKSSLGLFDKDITNDIKNKIEKHWAGEVLYRNKNVNGRSVCILPMLVHPSENLDMKHLRLFSLTDTISRYNKFEGNTVINPIGWDMFGLSVEKAAIENNISPKNWTTAQKNSMKEQLIQIGFDFDWSREIKTCDAQYYKWTQYIFLRLFEKGLAYQRKDIVNWDPIEKTVLGNEQLDDKNCSLISGAKVEKIIATEWYIRTTQFAKDLDDGLDNIKSENFNYLTDIQKSFIGQYNGVVVHMNMKNGKHNNIIDVWSSDPYKFMHGEYIAISSKNVILNEISEEDKSDLKCFNPITNTDMKVYITDKVNYPEGREIYIACPIFDSEDRKISELLNIPINLTKQTINIKSESKKAVKLAQEKMCGGYYVGSKMRDWLVSRQRYWGTPIPIIHCPNCGAVPVPQKLLPVELPDLSSHSKQSNLTNFESWVNCKCPKCSIDAKRETSTMDTFADSSWFYYRILDPENNKLPFEYDKLVKDSPISLFIQDTEHSGLYLYYARFMSYFLHSIGLSPTKEPFKNVLVQGMVLGQSYKVKDSEKYLQPADVEEDKKKKKLQEKGTGNIVTMQWEPYSSLKYDQEDPKTIIKIYGSDTIRLTMLAYVTPSSNKKWSNSVYARILNWQEKLWNITGEFLKHKKNNQYNVEKLTEEISKKYESMLWDAKNNAVAMSSYHFKYTQNINIVILELQKLTDTLTNNMPPEVIVNSKEYEHALAYLVIMLSPIAPHFCSELWAGLSSAPRKLIETSNTINWSAGVFDQRWPVVDLNYPLLIECKLNGKKRHEIRLEASEFSDLTAEKALKMMLDEVNIKYRTFIEKFELYPNCHAVLHVVTSHKREGSNKATVAPPTSRGRADEVSISA